MDFKLYIKTTLAVWFMLIGERKGAAEAVIPCLLRDPWEVLVE